MRTHREFKEIAELNFLSDLRDLPVNVSITALPRSVSAPAIRSADSAAVPFTASTTISAHRATSAKVPATMPASAEKSAQRVGGTARDAHVMAVLLETFGKSLGDDTGSKHSEFLHVRTFGSWKLGVGDLTQQLRPSRYRDGGRGGLTGVAGGGTTIGGTGSPGCG